MLCGHWLVTGLRLIYVQLTVSLYLVRIPCIYNLLWPKPLVAIPGDSALPTADSHAVCLGIMISSDLKSSNQCMQACRKASKMLGMIKRTISYRAASGPKCTRDNG